MKKLKPNFSFFFEERCSALSVPQSSILNIMISDLPRVDGVTMSEYADDITIYCRGADLQHVKSKIQDQIYLFHEWKKMGTSIKSKQDQSNVVYKEKNISSNYSN